MSVPSIPFSVFPLVPDVVLPVAIETLEKIRLFVCFASNHIVTDKIIPTDGANVSVDAAKYIINPFCFLG